MREPRFYENPSCAQVGGDFWFPEKADGSMNTVEMVMAKSICQSCPHKVECVEWGIKKEPILKWKAGNQVTGSRRERKI